MWPRKIRWSATERKKASLDSTARHPGKKQGVITTSDRIRIASVIALQKFEFGVRYLAFLLHHLFSYCIHIIYYYSFSLIYVHFFFPYFT